MSDGVWSFGRTPAVWARRSHPLSFWLRLAVLPALGATLWFRQHMDPQFLLVVVGLAVFAWAVERIFAAPEDDRAWPTRASLGEFQLGLDEPLAGDTSKAFVRGMMGLGSFGTLIMVGGAIVHSVPAFVVGVIVMLGAKLYAFDRLARAYDASKT